MTMRMRSGTRKSRRWRRRVYWTCKRRTGSSNARPTFWSIRWISCMPGTTSFRYRHSTSCTTSSSNSRITSGSRHKSILKGSIRSLKKYRGYIRLRNMVQLILVIADRVLFCWTMLKSLTRRQIGSERGEMSSSTFWTSIRAVPHEMHRCLS